MIKPDEIKEIENAVDNWAVDSGYLRNYIHELLDERRLLVAIANHIKAMEPYYRNMETGEPFGPEAEALIDMYEKWKHSKGDE